MSQDAPKRYWKSLKELSSKTGPPYFAEDEQTGIEISEENSFNRRQFLQAVGFSLAAATLSGCVRVPEEKVLSYSQHPEGHIPGRAEHYASTCGGCTAGCGLLVRTREGRPVKLEGNPDHPLSKGSLCAVGQASIMGVYDSQRLSTPMSGGSKATWDSVDQAISGKLDDIRRSGGSVRLLTGTVLSPSNRDMIGRFLSSFPGAKHIIYDPLSSSAILDAHQRTHGARVLPSYMLKSAKAIVSFDADFLGTWISPVEYAAAYGAARVPTGHPPQMSYHIQFESVMSVSGSNADERVRVSPAEMGAAISGLAVRLAKKAGGYASIANSQLSLPTSVPAALLDALAERLWQHHHEGEPTIVLCGSQDVNQQVACNFINHVLGNYGTTLDISKFSLQRQGEDSKLAELLSEINAGTVSALLIAGVNPVYELPGGQAFAEALKKVSLVVSFADREDETASSAHYICPDHHYLEAWSDAEPQDGTYSLVQPAVSPLGQTRGFAASLSAWFGRPQSEYNILLSFWRENIFPQQNEHRTFQAFWDQTLHDGIFVWKKWRTSPSTSWFSSSNFRLGSGSAGAGAGAMALVLYPKVGLLDGRHAHNPWLQELPDPITKVVWDNYASLSVATAKGLGVSDGDVVSVKAGEGGQGIELPALVQPGQADNVVAVALGYGRKGTERFVDVGYQWLESKPTLGENGLVGTNAAPLMEMSGGQLSYTREGVQVSKTGKTHSLASSQDYHNIAVPEKLALPGLEIRQIVQVTTLGEYIDDPNAGAFPHHDFGDGMWAKDHPIDGNHWGMAVDLNLCTGCSACVVACQVENNIPVVGKDEVARNRDLHWMRIDRYYSGDGDDVDVIHQPMMCQQCDNAPCETVCPVLATVHSAEGLNEQIYNRCVGTRYCANNCPYKVRRFNWFNYVRNDKMQNLVLNPDVTVRSRGVMEKCTFCVQRIQEAKIQAKVSGVPLADGDITPACQQTCPSQAITFGNMNDPKSEISKKKAGSRRFGVLEEINVLPSVHYLTLVRNRKGSTGGGHHE